MSKRLLALAAGVCLLAAGGTAQAYCAGGPFSGFYIGGAAGAARAQLDLWSSDDPRIEDNDTSFTISGLAGFNIQCGTFVLGLEGDIGYLGAETKGEWVGPTGPVYPKSSIDWFGTLRGKAGVTVDPTTMIYVTGGLAFADVSHKVYAPDILGAPFSQDDSGTRTGWTIGAGIEFLRHNNWLLRGEALYVDLGSEDHSYTVTACGIVCTTDTKWDDSFWVGRLGLSYKFGPEPVAYQPLK